MRKFVANYLIHANGNFLKNGILITKEDGTTIEYIDTTGNLKEIAQLSFQNGILMAGFVFVKTGNAATTVQPENTIESIIVLNIAQVNQLSVQDTIELAEKIQRKFPEMKIPEIAARMSETLQKEGFSKQSIPGVFLLTKTDLINLHFTSNTRLKKIL